MLLLDLSHTSHSPARTGVQRVALELRRALRATSEVTAITHDPHARAWRPLQPWEADSLDAPAPAQGGRGARWPLRAQLRGWLSRRGRTETVPLDLPQRASALLFPEIFTARTGENLAALFRAVRAPKVAVFHDAIPLRLPEFSPPGTVGRFPRYLDELRQFDGVAAVSEDSRQSLLDYWQWAGWSDHPPVIALPLGTDHISRRTSDAIAPASGAPPTVLCVGSIEGRKNHLTLLAAAEQLWTSGLVFTLDIIGGLQRETGAHAMARLQALQAAGRDVRHRGWVDDAALNEAYRSCAFTVYPSILEGFGIPVWESLLHGKPCVCSNRGAIAETARDGGCLPTATDHTGALAAAMRTLLLEPTALRDLTTAARERKSRPWARYAQELLAWADNLPTSHAQP